MPPVDEKTDEKTEVVEEEAKKPEATTNTDQPEGIKSEAETAKAMYEDNEKGEKEPDTESKDETETKSPDEDSEETGEQEEIADGEEAEALTLTLSKDSPLDDEKLAELTEFATEHKLDQAVAQAILEREEAAMTSVTEGLQSQHDASVAEWRQKIEDHPVYGGENLEKYALIANRPLEKFGNKEVSDLYAESGYANHPDIFDYHVKLGLAMGDDKFVDGPAPKPKRESRANRMYPDDVKKE